MSLNVNRLEMGRELANGIVQARCPACAENGHDKKGEHLRIYPDGRFGCCVHPKDKEHRRRIFALAGDKTPALPMRVRVASAARTATPATSISDSLKEFPGTLGTGKSESISSGLEASQASQHDLGTLGTGNFNPRAYGRDHLMHAHDVMYMCKEWETGVPSVPSDEAAFQPPEGAKVVERLPFLTADGTLSIPFGSPPRYHWWKLEGERMSVEQTLAEVKGRQSMEHGARSQ